MLYGNIHRSHQANESGAEADQRPPFGAFRDPARNFEQADGGHERVSQALQYRCDLQRAGLLGGLYRHRKTIKKSMKKRIPFSKYRQSA